MKNSACFDFSLQVHSEQEGRDLLRAGPDAVVMSIPPRSSRDLLRGDRPALQAEADATEPSATGLALGSLGTQIG